VSVFVPGTGRSMVAEPSRALPQGGANRMMALLLKRASASPTFWRALIYSRYADRLETRYCCGSDVGSFALNFGHHYQADKCAVPKCVAFNNRASLRRVER